MFFCFSPKERELSDADETRHVVVGHGPEAVAAPVQGLRVHPAPSRVAREKRVVQTCIILHLQTFLIICKHFRLQQCLFAIGNLIISLGY